MELVLNFTFLENHFSSDSLMAMHGNPRNKGNSNLFSHSPLVYCITTLSHLPHTAFISLLITYATHAPQNCSDLFHHPYHHVLQVLADRCLKLLSNLLHQTFYNYQSALNYCQDLTCSP
ncbi:hypothetical protein QL285_001817 [Trifolium repens]|nr:hypothetical protein QL285_001817 [Trifolium repens]